MMPPAGQHGSHTPGFTWPPVISLNLSLSSACGADCIYCPADRGRRIPARNMPFETAKKAIDDASAHTDMLRIQHVEIGENGDAFINKHALAILRYAKARIPNVTIGCYTNLQNLSGDTIDSIVREGLLDSLGLNVDGASNLTFAAVKKIDLRHVNQKLPLLLVAREKYASQLKLLVNVLTLRDYIKATTLALGRLPLKLQNPSLIGLDDDFEQIREGVQRFLRPGDGFGRPAPFLWAERPGVDTSTLDYSQYSCSQLERVLAEAFIAPDGSWYACCYDSNNRLVVGNILEQPLEEIARGERRRRLLEMLLQKKFGEIGAPCNTVNCCQAVDLP